VYQDWSTPPLVDIKVFNADDKKLVTDEKTGEKHPISCPPGYDPLAWPYFVGT